MLKNISILAITTIVLISCGTSSKTTTTSTKTTNKSKTTAVAHPKTSKIDMSVLKKRPDPKDVKSISISDSKEAARQSKKETIQISK